VLRLSPDGSYELAGSVAPKSDAGSDLTQVLQLLGPADAQGRRVFSIAGTM
jgi:general secretion pathway protein N